MNIVFFLLKAVLCLSQAIFNHDQIPKLTWLPFNRNNQPFQSCPPLVSDTNLQSRKGHFKFSNMLYLFPHSGLYPTQFSCIDSSKHASSLKPSWITPVYSVPSSLGTWSAPRAPITLPWSIIMYCFLIFFLKLLSLSYF